MKVNNGGDHLRDGHDAQQILDVRLIRVDPGRSEKFDWGLLKIQTCLVQALNFLLELTSLRLFFLPEQHRQLQASYDRIGCFADQRWENHAADRSMEMGFTNYAMTTEVCIHFFVEKHL